MSVLEAAPENARADGMVHELEWWRGHVRNPEFVAKWFGPHPNPDLQMEVELFLKGLAGGCHTPDAPLEVLDLGSGPVSILSNNFERNVKLTAADPLAESYRTILEHPRLPHLCLPVFAEGEKLAKQFGPRRFDACHIRNAIDHSVNPILVIYSMLSCIKPGGHLLMHGFEDEANAVGGVGLHRWNVRYNDEGLLIESLETKEAVLVEEQFAGMLRPIKRWVNVMYGRRWFNFIAQVL